MSNMVTIDEGPGVDELLAHVRDPALSASLRTTTLLMIPERRRDEMGPVFNPGTRAAFHHMRASLPEGISVDVASTDDEYVELILHSAEIWVPTLLLLFDNASVRNVSLSMIANYVYDRLKGLSAKQREGATVRSRVVVTTSKSGDKTVSFTYKGPADTYQAVMERALTNEKK